MKVKNKILFPQSQRGTLFQISLKIISLISPLMFLPWALNGSNPSIYGEYCALLALFNFLISLDFGMANLANGKVAGMLAGNKYLLMVNFINQGKRILNTIFLFLCIPILLVSYLLVEYLHNTLSYKLNLPLLIISFLFSLSVYFAFLGNFGLKLNLAQQQNQKAIFIMTTQTLIPLSGIIFFRTGLGLFHLVFLFIFLPQLLTWVNFLISAQIIRKRSFLYTELPEKVSHSKLIHEGSLFLFLQVANVLSTQIDALIVTLLLDSRSAAELAITWRYYAIPLQIISLFSTPLWALTAASKVNKTESLIFLKLKRLLFISLALLAGFAFLSFWIANPILGFWTNGLITPGYGLLFSCSLWLVVSGLVNPVANVLNGLGGRRFLLRIYSFSTIINIIFSVCLTLILKSNSGVLIGSIVAQIVFFLIPAFIYLKREISADA